MGKQISGAVGSGGRNAPADVATIQYLLNCVPASRGGPTPELVIDGICGPKTGMAIRNFQRLNQCAQDGRVDPGGRKLAALGSYDPYPNVPLQPMGQTAGKGAGGPGPGGKQGGGAFGKQNAGGGGFGKGDPFGQGGGGGFGKGDPFGQGGGFGKGNPFGNNGGGGGFGKGDPFANGGGGGFGKGNPFGNSGGGGFGKGDPFGNNGGGGGFGKGDPFGNGGQNPFGKTGGPGGKSSW